MARVRIPLAQPIKSRTSSFSKDSKTVNGYFEHSGKNIILNKRPGLQSLSLSPTLSAGQGQGMFSWNNYLVVGLANEIYLVEGFSTVTDIGAIAGTQNPLSFVTVQSDTYLAFHNGSNLYSMSAGTPPVFNGGVGISGVVSSVSITNAGGYYGYATSCTIAVGTPPTITATAHGLTVGQGVTFTGTLPTGMTVGTTYQVASTPTADTFTINDVTAGGGSGSAVVTSGTSSGVSFLASPTVTFSASPGTTAQGVALLYNHTVSSVTVTTYGSGYTSTPTITFSAPAGGTTATSTIISAYFVLYAPNKYVLASAPVTTAGSGYLTAPTITFSTGATYNDPALGYTVIDTSGTVTSIVITYGGFYASTELSSVTATISAPPDTTATGTVVMASSGITGPFAPGMAYLDDVVYVMGTNGNVYNSNSNDPTTWPGDYLTVSNDPDDGVALIKHQNYLFALGQWSGQFLYDNGNPTGSPLASYDSAKIEIGCANGYSVAKAPQTVLWVGQSQVLGRGVYMLEGLFPKKVSTEYIDKYLDSDDMTDVRSYCLGISGHTLYILTLLTTGITLVYDLNVNEWYQWTSQSGDTGTVDSGTETYFTPTFFNANIEYTPKFILQDETNGKLYFLSLEYTSDDGNNIYLRSVTDKEDWGNTQYKFFRSAEIIGDKAATTGYIRHSSNDYITKSTFRSVDLSAERPIVYQLGSARRRSWEFFHSDNVALPDLEAIELDLQGGE